MTKVVLGSKVRPPVSIESKISDWESSQLSRLPRTYTPTSNAEEKKSEALLTKKCSKCNKTKKHSEFRLNNVKELGKIIGVYRNNGCKKCEEKSPAQKINPKDLQEQLDDLKSKYSEDMKAIMKVFDSLSSHFKIDINESGDVIPLS